jgi:20S proteasome alpha/beta subunit
MTLIVSVVSTTGIIVAADSQVTYGETRWQTDKIKKLNDSCVWGGAGDLSFLQRFEEATAASAVATPLPALRDQLAGSAKQAAVTILQQDLRTAFPLRDPVENLHAYDLIFAEYREGKPKLLHVSPYGPEWIGEGFHAVGSGQPFAFALLQRFRGKTLEQDTAALLAYRVVSEAIQVASFGLGPPVVVWAVDSKGCRCLGKPEIDALEDAYGVLLEAEFGLLQGSRESSH